MPDVANAVPGNGCVQLQGDCGGSARSSWCGMSANGRTATQRRLKFLAYANNSISTAISGPFESPLRNISHKAVQLSDCTAVGSQMVGITFLFSKQRVEAETGKAVESGSHIHIKLVGRVAGTLLQKTKWIHRFLTVALADAGTVKRFSCWFCQSTSEHLACWRMAFQHFLSLTERYSNCVIQDTKRGRVLDFKGAGLCK